jgi:hypothetical protein
MSSVLLSDRSSGAGRDERGGNVADFPALRQPDAPSIGDAAVPKALDAAGVGSAPRARSLGFESSV